MKDKEALIQKANRSLHIKMGGTGDYLNQDISIQHIINILSGKSKKKAEDMG